MSDRGEYFGNLALKNFQEIADPEYYLWFPLAPGWYLVLTVLIVYVVWTSYSALIRYKKNAYRREALELLESINADHNFGQQNPREYLQRLRQLLKATALKVFPRNEIAGLTGAPWLDFLNTSVDEPVFDMVVQEFMGSSIYHPDYQPDATLLASFSPSVTRWLFQHRNPHIENTGKRDD